MTSKSKKIYFIGNEENFSDREEVCVIVCTEDELSNKVDSFIQESYCDPDKVTIYECGRKGLLPKRTIQFF